MMKLAYIATLVSQYHCCVLRFFLCSMMKLLIYFVIIIVEVSFKILNVIDCNTEILITHFIHTIIPCTVQFYFFIFMHRLLSYPNFNARNMQRNSQMAAILK